MTLGETRYFLVMKSFEDIPIETERTKNAVIQIVDVLDDASFYKTELLGMVRWCVCGKIGDDGVREPLNCLKVLDRFIKVFGPCRFDVDTIKRFATDWLCKMENDADSFIKSGLSLKDFYAMHGISYYPL